MADEPAVSACSRRFAKDTRRPRDSARAGGRPVPPPGRTPRRTRGTPKDRAERNRLEARVDTGARRAAVARAARREAAIQSRRSRAVLTKEITDGAVGKQI